MLENSPDLFLLLLVQLLSQEDLQSLQTIKKKLKPGVSHGSLQHGSCAGLWAPSSPGCGVTQPRLALAVWVLASSAQPFPDARKAPGLRCCLLGSSWGDLCSFQPGSLMSSSGTQCTFRPPACRKILCKESLGKGQKPLGSSSLKMAFL